MTLTRRQLLGGAASACVAILSYNLVNLGESMEPPYWCPSEEEIEGMAWIRGHFEQTEKEVTVGERFRSRLVIENSGGQPGTYDDSIVLKDYTDNGEWKYLGGIGVEVPPHTTTSASITTTAPETAGEWVLEAPGLGSSCDVIAPATQYLTIAEVNADGE